MGNPTIIQPVQLRLPSPTQGARACALWS